MNTVTQSFRHYEDRLYRSKKGHELLIWPFLIEGIFGVTLTVIESNKK
jgi:hypothetical protein